MATGRRAIHPEDKQERRDAILDAAEALLRGAPERVASVAEVATQAGLAKGTVYLYFPSKEELLLAVHERRVAVFLRALIERVESPAQSDFDTLFALLRAHLIDPPLFLPLAARCFGLMAHGLPPTVALAFKLRMAAYLERAGAGIEGRFPTPGAPSGWGLALLRRAYALILGLWQMSASIGGGAPLPVGAVLPPALAWDYPQELEAALRTLWQGTVGPPPRDGAGR